MPNTVNKHTEAVSRTRNKAHSFMRANRVRTLKNITQSRRSGKKLMRKKYEGGEEQEKKPRLNAIRAKTIPFMRNPSQDPIAY